MWVDWHQGKLEMNGKEENVINIIILIYIYTLQRKPGYVPSVGMDDETMLFSETGGPGGDEELKEGGSSSNERIGAAASSATLSKWLEEANGLHVTLSQVYIHVHKSSLPPSIHGD